MIIVQVYFLLYMQKKRWYNGLVTKSKPTIECDISKFSCYLPKIGENLPNSEEHDNLLVSVVTSNCARRKMLKFEKTAFYVVRSIEKSV
jgi:hypothetical protein